MRHRTLCVYACHIVVQLDGDQDRVFSYSSICTNPGNTRVRINVPSCVSSHARHARTSRTHARHAQSRRVRSRHPHQLQGSYLLSQQNCTAKPIDLFSPLLAYLAYGGQCQASYNSSTHSSAVNRQTPAHCGASCAQGRAPSLRVSSRLSPAPLSNDVPCTRRQHVDQPAAARLEAAKVSVSMGQHRTGSLQTSAEGANLKQGDHGRVRHHCRERLPVDANGRGRDLQARRGTHAQRADIRNTMILRARITGE